MLGAGHPDTISSAHNLAELLHAMGEEKEANRLRQGLLDTLEEQDIANVGAATRELDAAEDAEAQKEKEIWKEPAPRKRRS